MFSLITILYVIALFVLTLFIISFSWYNFQSYYVNVSFKNRRYYFKKNKNTLRLLIYRYYVPPLKHYK